jgi:hypothetical protein
MQNKKWESKMKSLLHSLDIDSGSDIDEKKKFASSITDFNKNVLTYNPNRPIVDYQGRIYTSGAITGTTDYLERFDKAERKYTRKGY